MSVDQRNEKIGAKIRDAEFMKVPIMMIVGDKEENNNSVSIRRRHKGDIGEFDNKEFMIEVKSEINKRSI